MLSLQFNPKSTIRIELINGGPWFAAKDICDVLGLGNNRQAIARLDDDEKGVITSDTPGGKQNLQFVSESGLYNLIFQSRKPEARKFSKWVTSEVLPQIRKTGSYIPLAASQLPDNPLANAFKDFVRQVTIDGITWYKYRDVINLTGFKWKGGGCHYTVMLDLHKEKQAIKMSSEHSRLNEWYVNWPGLQKALLRHRRIECLNLYNALFGFSTKLIN